MQIFASCLFDLALSTVCTAEVLNVFLHLHIQARAPAVPLWLQSFAAFSYSCNCRTARWLPVAILALASLRTRLLLDGKTAANWQVSSTAALPLAQPKEQQLDHCCWAIVVCTIILLVWLS